MARLKAGMPPATEEMLRWLSMLGRRPRPAGCCGGDAVPDTGGEWPLDPAKAANGDTACCTPESRAATAARCALAAVGGTGGLRVSWCTMAKYSLQVCSRMQQAQLNTCRCSARHTQPKQCMPSLPQQAHVPGQATLPLNLKLTWAPVLLRRPPLLAAPHLGRLLAMARWQGCLLAARGHPVGLLPQACSNTRTAGRGRQHDAQREWRLRGLPCTVRQMGAAASTVAGVLE